MNRIKIENIFFIIYSYKANNLTFMYFCFLKNKKLEIK